MACRQQAEDFIAMLQKGEIALTQIAVKLEEEAAQRFCKPGEVNPVQLVKSIQKLANELPALQSSCRELLSLKQGLIDAAQRQLAANHARLKQLCEVAGAQPVDEDAYQSFAESIKEWNNKLGQRNLADGACMSRDEMNVELARWAMTITAQRQNEC